MNELAFDLQRFATANPYEGLDDDGKTNLFQTGLPHLRIFSAVVHSPFIKPILDQDKESVEFLKTYVNPALEFAGALFGTQGLNIEHGLSITVNTVEVVDELLGIIDTVDNSEGTKTFADFGNEITSIISKIGSIADSYLQLKGDETIFMELSAATLAYGANVIATFDGTTPEEKEDLAKAAAELVGAELSAIVKSICKDASAAEPFSYIDIFLSVVIGAIEIVSTYGQKIGYYLDDGLPEETAFKEAMLDAVAGGLHDGFSNYAKGIDDWIFDTSRVLMSFGAWMGDSIKSLIGGESVSKFTEEYSLSDKNYAEWWRKLAQRLAYGTSDNADLIEIDAANSSLYAQDGDDRIYNVFPNVTIYGGHGNDSISLYEGAKYNSIFGGNGADYLYSYDSGNTLYGGAGNDHLVISGNKNVIFGNEGGDIFFVQGDSNSISGGAGTDLIILSGAKNAIIGYTQGDGVDAIYGYDTSDVIKIKGEYSTAVSGDDVIIQVGKGGLIVKDAKDLKININTIELEEGESLPAAEGALITNPYDNAIILMPGLWGTEKALRGTSGDDYIENTLDNIMIYGLDGDDTIINYGKHVTINAGGGNDHVENYGASVKINGGADDDYIYNEAARVTISGGDGKDTVDNAGKNSLIDGGNDMDSIKNSGESVTINSGGGNDRIVNLASNVMATGYDDDNYISNTKSNVTLSGGDDNDYIYSSGDHVSINAGEGNNSVSIDGSAGGYQTITAGDGNNYINNSNAELSTISAGSGNDTIITGGGNGSKPNHTSIVAGAGDNQITVNSGMSKGGIYAGNGSDNIVSLGGGDDSVIAGIWASTINVGAGTGSDLIYTSGRSSFINAGAGRNFVSLGSSYNNTIVTGKGNDTITFGDASNNNVIIFGEGNDLVVNYHAGDTIKAAGTLTRSTVGADVILSDGSSNMTLQGATGKKINTAALSSNDNVYKILVADKTVGDTLLPDGTEPPTPEPPPVETITNTVSGVSITSTDADEIIDNNGSLVTISALGGNDTIHNDGKSVIIDGGAGNDYLNNRGSLVTLLGGSGNDSIRNLGGNDGYGDSVTIDGGAGDDFIFNSGKNILFKYTGGNDTIQGFRADSTLSIGDGKGSYSTQVSGLDVIVTVGDAKITLSGAAVLDTVHINDAGTPDAESKLITGTSSADSVKTTLDGATIKTYGGNDTIRAYGDAALIDGGAGNDSIRNYGDNATILGGEGNDSVRNYGENVTITGGSGNDTLLNYGNNVLFTHAAGEGNDVIMGFNETSTLSISGDAYSTQVSGNNVVVTAGTGKIILAGAAKLDTVNIDGKQASTKLTLTNSSSAKVTLPAAYISANASARSAAIQITGNGLDNSILGGSGNYTLAGGAGNDSIDGGTGNDSMNGGSGNDYILGGDGNDKLQGYTGNDTLSGGFGNDSLWGGSGSDIFIYISGDGKDMIYNFDDSDMLQITGDWSAAYYNASGRVVFKVDSTYSAIILENSSATTFNVNGTAYQISNNKFVKQ